MEKINKKGQEEIMGFMLIITMVVIIGITLAFVLRPIKVKEVNNLQVENLLYSLVKTDYQNRSINNWIAECERGDNCGILGNALDTLLNASLEGSGMIVGGNLRGYSLNMQEGINYNLTVGKTVGENKGAAIVVKDTLIRLKF